MTDTKDMTTETHTTCTVVTGARGERCGRPAVVTVGEFAECAHHAVGPISIAAAKTIVGPKVGEKVEVRRHGKTYEATIVRVGARGAVYAEVVYGTGAKRTVRV